jgi:uridine kinase
MKYRKSTLIIIKNNLILIALISVSKFKKIGLFASPCRLCYHVAMKRKPLIIGVAGGTASGKTTIANAIMESINHPQMVMMQHDAYYKDASHLPLAERARINFDHPDALETELMVRHLRGLIAGRSIEMPVYDFSTHTRLKKGMIKKPAKVIIIEGILIFCEQALRELMDVKIFVDTDSDLRFIRRLKRDIQERQRSLESVIGQYLGTVRPMHIAFVEPSRKYADIIIPEGHNPVSTAMVVTMIRQRLHGGEP